MLGGPLELSVTEMASKAGWLSGEARVESSRAVHDLLLACLEPELETLLPKMGRRSHGTVLHRQWCARYARCVARQRIRDEIAPSESIRRMGLQFGISKRMVGTDDASKNERNESAVGRLVAEIQQRVDEELSSRMMQHE